MENIELFKEFLRSDVTLKAFAQSKGVGYSAMRLRLLKTERLFHSNRVPVEDYFPEQVAAYKVKYSWANKPGYVHLPPDAIRNKRPWLVFIAAHEALTLMGNGFEIDTRKLSDITVAELVTIIRSIVPLSGN